MIEELDPNSNDLFVQIKEFYEEVADELDACNPEAFDLIYQIMTEKGLSLEKVKEIISDFNFDYGEELENCNEYGFERLQEIMKNNYIE